MSLYILGGYVLVFDPASTPSDPRITFQVKDIFVEGDRITRIEADIPVPPGAKIINAHDHIVSPGFIDTHRHLWVAAARGIANPTMGNAAIMEYLCHFLTARAKFWTPEDVYWGQLVGATEALASGITTVLDHSHISHSRDHVTQALEATLASGIRSVYAYCNTGREEWEGWQVGQFNEIGHRLQTSKDKRVTLGLAYDKIAFEPPATVSSTLAAAETAGSSLTTFHWGAYMPMPLSAVQASTHSLSSSFVVSHFNRPAPADIALVRDLGLGIACTPESELQMGLGECAAFPFINGGATKVGLGVDTHSAYSGDMFAQMRIALQSARSIRNDDVHFGRDGGPPGRWTKNLVHTASHVVRLATLGGAETLNMADRVGSIEVGKLADLFLISLSSPNMLGTTSSDESLVTSMVTCAQSSDVRTVVINGEIVKENGELKKVQWNQVVDKFREHQTTLEKKFKEADEGKDLGEQVVEMAAALLGIGPELLV